MAGKGRRFSFHGAFGTKAKAKRKERQMGGFIRTAIVRGRRRWLVLKKRGR